MKKLLAGLLCSAMLITPSLATGYTIMVEGTVLDLSTAAPYQESGRVMLPLRMVSEALGFVVTWDQTTQTATLDNGTMRSTITIGTDGYTMEDRSTMGSSTSQSFGAAPVLTNGTTYVPSELFTLLCGQITVKDGRVTIRMNAQTPNPMTQYPDLDAAAKALGFAVASPTIFPEGYSLSSVWGIGGTLLELRFQRGERVLTFRMSQGTEDISGDFLDYESTVRQPAKHTEFTLKGDGTLTKLVLWTEDKYTYSLSFSQGVEADQAVAVAESVTPHSASDQQEAQEEAQEEAQKEIQKEIQKEAQKEARKGIPS